MLLLILSAALHHLANEWKTKQLDKIINFESSLQKVFVYLFVAISAEQTDAESWRSDSSIRPVTLRHYGRGRWWGE